MYIRNIVRGAAIALSMAAFSSFAPAALAQGLQPPDSDALTAGYQLIQFDLLECQAIAPKQTANGQGLVSSDILKLSAKLCGAAGEYKPKLEKIAKENDFKLPRKLPFYLTARYTALIRNQGNDLGSRYLQDQISSHEDALAVFQLEADTGKNAQVKAAAAEVIPTVQANLALLKAELAKH